MAFYYRIVKKCTLNNELPEISLRRSPPTPMIKPSSSIGKDIKTPSPQSHLNSKSNSESANNYAKVTNSTHQEPISIKLSLVNKNVSIIPNNHSSDAKMQSEVNRKTSEKQGSQVNERKITSAPQPPVHHFKKDEYDFEDELEQQKLGFLNTLQLTSKKSLNATVKSNANNSSMNVPTTSPTASKRKSNEIDKFHFDKKPKVPETKHSSTDNKFLFTKKAAGHEISFDMSPKPLGFKPSLEKMKNDILMVKNAADVKAHVKKIDSTKAAMSSAKEIVPPKAKKLPMLLPKSATHSETRFNDGRMKPPTTCSSPTAFFIKKPLVKNDLPSSKEISVTKIEDQNPHLQVYGPKSPANTKERDNYSNDRKSDGGFVQPLPPKPKFSSPTSMNNPKHAGAVSSAFQATASKLNAPLQLYACRTPFYVSSI